MRATAESAAAFVRCIATCGVTVAVAKGGLGEDRSEEHTSELQSLGPAVLKSHPQESLGCTNHNF